MSEKLLWRFPLGIYVLVFAVSCFTAASEAEHIQWNATDEMAQDNRPNIIFLLADDLGYGDIEYNGGKAKTPNLNQMASGTHSVQFSRFYSGSPVCSPTRGTVLTGRNHNRYCLWKANTPGKHCSPRNDFHCPAQHPLPLSEMTVAEILKEQGYLTGVFGKWHLGDLKPLPNGQLASNPSQNGFDEWKVTERSVPTSTPNCACFNTSECVLGHYKRRGPPPCTNYHSLDENLQLVAHNSIILNDDSHFIVDELAAFLNSTRENGTGTHQPFFAYIPFHAVHKNYIASSPYDEAYKNRKPAKLSMKEIDYYSTITALDAAVGQVRQLLHAHNISRNTMLWFTSDNGPENRTPGSTAGLRDRKGSLYEGGIRVPGIIEWPAVIQSNRITDYPVVTNDFLPTVMDVLGIQPPSNRELDGISILPLLREKTQDDKQQSYGQRNSTIKWAFNIKGNFNGKYKAVILDNNFKIVAQYKKGKIINAELYNLEVDYSEQNDISAHHNDTLVELLLELENWMQSIKKSAEEIGCIPSKN